MQAKIINDSDLTVDRLIDRKRELEQKLRELELRLVEDENSGVINDALALQASIQLCQDEITSHATRVREARTGLKRLHYEQTLTRRTNRKRRCRHDK